VVTVDGLVAVPVSPVGVVDAVGSTEEDGLRPVSVHCGAGMVGDADPSGGSLLEQDNWTHSHSAHRMRPAPPDEPYHVGSSL